MMDVFTPAFRTDYPNWFSQRLGNGANQVFDQAISGNGWLLTGIGSPRDGNGASGPGTDLFGKDWLYQYIQNDLCLRFSAAWNNNTFAGLGASAGNSARTGSAASIGGRCACYPV